MENSLFLDTKQDKKMYLPLLVWVKKLSPVVIEFIIVLLDARVLFSLNFPCHEI